MDIVNRRLAEITPYENNPRFNDEAVDAVAASIQEFGFKVPIVLDSEGVIVAGHKPYEVVGHVLDPDILEKKESFRTNMAACDVPCRMTAPNIFMEQVEARRPNACFI